jgi:MoxR-like ATPase
VSNLNDREIIEQLVDKLGRAQAEIGKVFLGQEDIVRNTFAGAVAGGNILTVGIPGLAKTLLASNLAEVMALSFSRIQFTPDLMPSDILGIEIKDDDAFRFINGPIFAQFILGDEINRAPPKTQSALLEAMQEKQVTVAGKTHILQRPFIVMATQNPIEQEGTYPLPEAQLDRFMIKLDFDYPDEGVERQIALNKASTRSSLRDLFEQSAQGRDLTRAPDENRKSKVSQIFAPHDLILMQTAAKTLPVPNDVVEAAVQIVRRTRPGDSTAPDFIRKNVDFGAGPRASEAFTQFAQAQALLRGELSPNVGDILAVVQPVLEHRVSFKYGVQDKANAFQEAIQHLIRGI